MTDYGYEETDMGYGDAQPDYGYGEPEPDYGYGDAAPADTDYGYGDAKPDDGAVPTKEDLGYGTQEDYGYGSSDMGYSSQEDMPAKSARTRPKRRCSVTKFSIESGAGDALNAVSDINKIRQGGQVQEIPPSPVEEKSIAKTVDESESDKEQDAFQENPAPSKVETKKLGAMDKMKKLGKRLSIFH